MNDNIDGHSSFSTNTGPRPSSIVRSSPRARASDVGGTRRRGHDHTESRSKPKSARGVMMEPSPYKMSPTRIRSRALSIARIDESDRNQNNDDDGDRLPRRTTRRRRRRHQRLDLDDTIRASTSSTYSDLSQSRPLSRETLSRAHTVALPSNMGNANPSTALSPLQQPLSPSNVRRRSTTRTLTQGLSNANLDSSTTPLNESFAPRGVYTSPRNESSPSISISHSLTRFGRNPTARVRTHSANLNLERLLSELRSEYTLRSNDTRHTTYYDDYDDDYDQDEHDYVYDDGVGSEDAGTPNQLFHHDKLSVPTTKKIDLPSGPTPRKQASSRGTLGYHFQHLPKQYLTDISPTTVTTATTKTPGQSVVNEISMRDLGISPTMPVGVPSLSGQNLSFTSTHPLTSVAAIDQSSTNVTHTATPWSPSQATRHGLPQSQPHHQGEQQSRSIPPPFTDNSDIKLSPSGRRGSDKSPSKDKNRQKVPTTHEGKPRMMVHSDSLTTPMPVESYSNPGKELDTTTLSPSSVHGSAPLSPIKRTLESSTLMQISQRQVLSLKAQQQQDQREEDQIPWMGYRHIDPDRTGRGSIPSGSMTPTSSQSQDSVDDSMMSQYSIQSSPEQEPFLESLSFLEISQLQAQRLKQGTPYPRQQLQQLQQQQQQKHDMNKQESDVIPASLSRRRSSVSVRSVGGDRSIAIDDMVLLQTTSGISSASKLQPSDSKNTMMRGDGRFEEGPLEEDRTRGGGIRKPNLVSLPARTTKMKTTKPSSNVPRSETTPTTTELEDTTTQYKQTSSSRRKDSSRNNPKSNKSEKQQQQQQRRRRRRQGKERSIPIREGKEYTDRRKDHHPITMGPNNDVMLPIIVSSNKARPTQDNTVPHDDPSRRSQQQQQQQQQQQRRRHRRPSRRSTTRRRYTTSSSNNRRNNPIDDRPWRLSPSSQPLGPINPSYHVIGRMQQQQDDDNNNDLSAFQYGPSVIVALPLSISPVSAFSPVVGGPLLLLPRRRRSNSGPTILEYRSELIRPIAVRASEGRGERRAAVGTNDESS